jgi:2',3'-cyclic-nucleotide 2'-phosphodiesterase/3'-nucleotidase
LLSNDFRLSGGNGFQLRGRPIGLDPEPVLVRELLQREIRAATPALEIEAEPIWRFAPMPGTRVICLTGPGAQAHLHELAAHGVRATPLPLDTDGFLPLQIAL